MEIKEMKPTAEVEYQVISKNPDGTVRDDVPPQRLWLRVRFVGSDSTVDIFKRYIRRGETKEETLALTLKEVSANVSLGEMNRAYIAMAIEEWDLVLPGGTPIPVTEETKRLYVPHIACAETVEGMVGFHLAEFVRNPGNFLKN